MGAESPRSHMRGITVIYTKATRSVMSCPENTPTARLLSTAAKNCIGFTKADAFQYTPEPQEPYEKQYLTLVTVAIMGPAYGSRPQETAARAALNSPASRLGKHTQ